ncbi:hypothetical protein Mapa_007980 [Marchantia paleacea]|nr:hypothetical protein Mapa_007980 [Marchantia paleacea]
MAECERFERGGNICICSTRRSFLLFCLLLLSVKSGSACPSQKNDDPRMFFVFGDSYADTGNAPPIASSWRFPYGLSWPGQPTGRFSNGIVKTDVLASEALCLSSPPPYAQFLNASLSGGINFAVAGSGTMQAFGTPPFSDQVDWFSGYVDSEFFSPHLLKNAVVFVSISGNDYAVYNGTTLQGYLPLVTQVVDLIERNLRQLYTLGVRNFMVSSVAPLRCLPARTASTGYTECPTNNTVDRVISAHNLLLRRTISSLIKASKDSNFILLEQTKALSYILKHLSDFGLTEGLRPCCTGSCGETDANGNLLYTVCDDPDKHLFWDYFHPTQAGWKAVVDLYSRSTRPGFTRFSPSLAAWADNL